MRNYVHKLLAIGAGLHVGTDLIVHSANITWFHQLVSSGVDLSKQVVLGIDHAWLLMLLTLLEQ